MAKDKKVIIKPLADRVLVKRAEASAAKSASGIIIPDTAQKEKSKHGIVIAVGPGKMSDDGTLVSMTVKKGAAVIFNSGWDNEVEIAGDDAEYFLVKESDILAIVE
jgi:chaperonin GroES